MITSFTWDNGTEAAPIQLTSEQINKLLTLAQNTEIMSDVRGYITTQNGNIARSTKYTLQQAYPNLHIIANEMSDSFTVTLNKSTVYEGDTAKITAIGISQDLLEYHVEHVVTLIDGSLSESAIINRFSLNSNGNITIAPALENDTWTDVVTIVAYPSYSTIDGPNAQTLTLTVRAIGVSSVSLDIAEEVDSAETVECEVNYQPTNNSKKSSMQEALTLSPSSTAGATINKVNGKWMVTSATISSNSFTGYIDLVFNASIEGVSVAQATSRTTLLHIGVTSIILDQTGSVIDTQSCFLTPQNHGSYAGNDATNNVVCWIRQNSHAYVGVYRNGVLRLKQLSDTDRRYYTNGKASDIYGQFGMTGLKPEVFVKIPPFYYRSSYVDRNFIDTKMETEIVKISFSRSKPSDFDEEGSGWNFWDGQTLIGVYPPCYRSNVTSYPNVTNDGTCMYSFSTLDVEITSENDIVPGNTSSKVFDWQCLNLGNKSVNMQTYQSNKGGGYKSFGLYEKNIIQLLYLGYYSNTDVEVVLGKGNSSSGDNISRNVRPGFTDTLGMRDTTPANGSYDGADNLVADYYSDTEVTSKYGAINFWGLENICESDESYSVIAAVNNSTVVDYLDIIDYVIDARELEAGEPHVYGVEDLDLENMPPGGSGQTSYVLEYNGATVLLIIYASGGSLNRHVIKYIFGEKCLLLPKNFTTTSFTTDSPLRAAWNLHGTAGLSVVDQYVANKLQQMFALSNQHNIKSPARTCYKGPMEIVAPNEAL